MMTRHSSKKISPTGQRKPRKIHPIAMELYKAKSSPAAVARLEGVSEAHVSNVIRGRRTSDKIRKRIESITRKPWHKLVAEQS